MDGELSLITIEEEELNDIKDEPQYQMDVFKPKICDPLWFMNDIENNNEDNQKHLADYLFYIKDYKGALEAYSRLLQCPKFGNCRVLIAEVQEAVSLCLKNLGKLNEAEHEFHRCDVHMTCADLKSSALFVKSLLIKKQCQETSDYEPYQTILKRLIILNPFNHFLWHELCAVTKENPREQILYLIKTRHLLEVNESAIQDFIKEKHQNVTSKVEKMIAEIEDKFDPKEMFYLNAKVKCLEIANKLDDEWLQEQHRMDVLQMADNDVNKLFHIRFLSHLSNDAMLFTSSDNS